MITQRRSSLLKSAAVAVALSMAACDSSATTPPPQNAATAPPPAPPVAVIARIPACDALFTETQACARNVTSDPIAVAHFEGKVQAARAAAMRAEFSQDPGQIAHATNACIVALEAYRISPCGG